MSEDDSRGSLTPTLRILFLVLAACLSIEGMRMPAARDADSTPDEEFSQERARRHLQAVARVAHWTTSPAIDNVRRYLLGQFASIGLDVDVQSGEVEGYSLKNLIVRIPGAATDRDMVLFACHYDSVARGPGAADDGAAVASFVECARALLSGPKLQNDIVFLFTDGEEAGLLGAKLFREHLFAERVDVVFNFEAIGNHGPSIMFETGEGNGRLVQEFARCAPRKVATSLAPAIYEKMPNDTDFSVFRRAGLTGLNFAIVGGNSAYHSPFDTPENVTPGTLQHQGDLVLSLARHFGNLELSDIGEPDRTFFDLGSFFFVSYPGAWNPLVSLLALGAVVLAFVRALRSRVLTLASVVRGPLFALLFAAVCGGAAFGLARAITPLGERIAPDDPVQHGDAFSASFAVFGQAAVALAAALTLLAVFARGERADRRTAELALGGAIVWCGLTAVCTLALPLASYLFAWPTLVCSLGLISFATRMQHGRPPRAAVLSNLAALALLGPTLGVFCRLMSKRPDVSQTIGAVGVALGVLILFPSVAWIRARTWAPRFIAWAVAIGLLCAFSWLRAAGY